MLDLRNVVESVTQGVRAVDGARLAPERGALGPIGHDGAGKRTLARTMADPARS